MRYCNVYPLFIRRAFFGEVTAILYWISCLVVGHSGRAAILGWFPQSTQCPWKSETLQPSCGGLCFSRCDCLRRRFVLGGFNQLMVGDHLNPCTLPMAPPPSPLLPSLSAVAPPIEHGKLEPISLFFSLPSGNPP